MWHVRGNILDTELGTTTHNGNGTKIATNHFGTCREQLTKRQWHKECNQPPSKHNHKKRDT
jgi:hypothetical protein